MSMSQNQTIHLVEVPIGGNGGLLWNRLHDERDDICRALLHETSSQLDERKVLLQARLRKVDDELDRLMARTH